MRKKTFVGPPKNGDRKQKERQKKKEAIAKLFGLHVNGKISFRNKQYLPYPSYIKMPQELISWASIENKMPNHTIFFRCQLWSRQARSHFYD